MPFLSSETKIAEMLGIAEARGMQASVASEAELDARFGPASGYVQIPDASGAFSLYYSRHQDKWCLNRIGPPTPRKTIPKSEWNRMPMPESEWLPVSLFQKPGKPSDPVPVGALTWGMLPPGKSAILVGRVVAVDGCGLPQEVDVGGAFPAEGLPSRWRAIHDQEAAELVLTKRIRRFGNLGVFSKYLKNARQTLDSGVPRPLVPTTVARAVGVPPKPAAETERASTKIAAPTPPKEELRAAARAVFDKALEAGDSRDLANIWAEARWHELIGFSDKAVALRAKAEKQRLQELGEFEGFAEEEPASPAMPVPAPLPPAPRPELTKEDLASIHDRVLAEALAAGDARHIAFQVARIARLDARGDTEMAAQARRDLVAMRETEARRSAVTEKKPQESNGFCDFAEG